MQRAAVRSGASIPWRGMLLAVVLLVVLGVAVATGRRVLPVATSAPVSAANAGTVFLALEDGRLQRINLASGAIEVTPAERFGHLYAASGTQIAFDATTQRLWFSDTHTAVRSIDLRTGEPGDTLGGFADSALVGCATVSDGRPIAVDAKRRRLFVPVGTGGVLVYHLDTLRLQSTLSASVLETEPGLLPPLAVDEESGALWYGAADGSLVEVVGTAQGFRPTGRRLAYASDPHLVRSLAASGRVLLALDARGEVRAFDLDRASEIDAPSLATAGHAVGIGAVR